MQKSLEIAPRAAAFSALRSDDALLPLANFKDMYSHSRRSKNNSPFDQDHIIMHQISRFHSQPLTLHPWETAEGEDLDRYHRAASIIQAHYLGYIARKRFRSLKYSVEEAARVQQMEVARQRRKVTRLLKKQAEDLLLALHAQSQYNLTRDRHLQAKGQLPSATTYDFPTISLDLWSAVQAHGLDPVQLLVEAGMSEAQIQSILQASNIDLCDKQDNMDQRLTVKLLALNRSRLQRQDSAMLECRRSSSGGDGIFENNVSNSSRGSSRSSSYDGSSMGLPCTGFNRVKPPGLPSGPRGSKIRKVVTRPVSVNNSFNRTDGRDSAHRDEPVNAPSAAFVHMPSRPSLSSSQLPHILMTPVLSRRHSCSEQILSAKPFHHTIRNSATVAQKFDEAESKTAPLELRTRLQDRYCVIMSNASKSSITEETVRTADMISAPKSSPVVVKQRFWGLNRSDEPVTQRPRSLSRVRLGGLSQSGHLVNPALERPLGVTEAWGLTEQSSQTVRLTPAFQNYLDTSGSKQSIDHRTEPPVWPAHLTETKNHCIIKSARSGGALAVMSQGFGEYQ